MQKFLEARDNELKCVPERSLARPSPMVCDAAGPSSTNAGGGRRGLEVLEGRSRFVGLPGELEASSFASSFRDPNLRGIKSQRAPR